MATNDYHFVTTWQIAASPDEISSVLSDAAGLARWWPSVYLQVRVVDDGDHLGVGKVVDLRTNGFLPYTPALATDRDRVGPAPWVQPGRLRRLRWSRNVDTPARGGRPDAAPFNAGHLRLARAR